jgi:hypothetical protein
LIRISLTSIVWAGIQKSRRSSQCKSKRTGRRREKKRRRGVDQKKITIIGREGSMMKDGFKSDLSKSSLSSGVEIPAPFGDLM